MAGEELQSSSQSILLAASRHDVDSLRTLLRTGSASVVDPDTGRTPLHAAILACSSASSASQTLSSQGEAISSVRADGESLEVKADGVVDSRNDGENEGRGGREEAAANTVRLLLQNGAIWNDLDINDETPGCVAWRLGFKDLYEIMVDAGVRAELLLNRLDEYEQLQDEEEDEEEENGADSSREPTNHLDPNPDDPKAANEADKDPPDPIPPTNPNNPTYLQSPLTITPTRILDSSRNSIMMTWETPIMRRTATLLAPCPSLRILNIGHGMGIIDRFFRDTSPSTHHIIEAHPSILAQMRRDGWAATPGLTVHAGRWQDVVPRLIAQEMLFDVVYFDTFAEDYRALRDFFADFVVGLLDDGGRWGFFNGLGADRQVCYDVYGKVVGMDLFEAGFETEWEVMKVEGGGGEEWEGVRRRYWVLDEYRLPVCRFVE